MAERFAVSYIPDLLNEAPLISGSWNAAASCLTLDYECLRRNTDGSDIEDCRVSIEINGVTAIAMAYDPGALHMRPSEFILPDHLRVAHLSPWPIQETEALFTINSASAAEDIEFFARCDWIFGDMHTGRSAKYKLGLLLDDWIPNIRILMWVCADTITPLVNGRPFPLNIWAEQYNAWWENWGEHWDKAVNDENEQGDFVMLEDTFIPLREDPPPDLSYRPPAERAFDLSPTDAPAEIVAPLRDWFESLLERDWMRRAEAAPNIDLEPEKQAKAVMAAFQGINYGRWDYARSIDQWWVEGNRAHVRIRGIEHSMPNEGKSAENIESVWDFSLRCRQEKWKVSAWQQGWPCYGSAEKKPSTEKPWLKEWNTGKVKSGDE